MSGAILERQPTIQVLLRRNLILRSYKGGLSTFACDIPLWFETNAGTTSLDCKFRVDTGCSITSVGIDAAQALGFPLPPADAPEFTLGGTTPVGSDRVRVQVFEPHLWWTAGREGEPFLWPILYLLAPASRRQQPPLLGLGGVINTCRWTIHGPTSALLYDGYIQFDDRRSLENPSGGGTGSEIV